MFGKKNYRYKEKEVSDILGIAINILRKKKKEDSINMDNMNFAALNKKSILKSAEKFQVAEKKKQEKIKKNPLKEKKKVRSKKKIVLYTIYFVVWGLLLIALVIPYIIIDQNQSEAGFESLWLFIMIVTSIIGLISGMFIAELEGIIGGFLLGAITGIGLFFLLKTGTGRIVSISVLSLLSIILFIFVFKRRFQSIIKNK